MPSNTPHKKKARGPDLFAIMRRSPEQLRIRFRGHCYRWVVCAACQQKFWKNTSDRTGENRWGDRINQFVCSEPCRKIRYRVMNAARQKRYRIAYDRIHGKGAWSQRHQRSLTRRRANGNRRTVSQGAASPRRGLDRGGRSIRRNHGPRVLRRGDHVSR